MPKEFSDTVRKLEMLRHTSALIMLYDMQGNSVVQNVKAEMELDSEVTQSNESGTGNSEQGTSINADTFLPHFRDRNDVRKLVDGVLKGETVRMQAKVITSKGKRYHLIKALKILDPLTGNHLILIHEEDVTDAVKQHKEAVATKLADKLKVW